MRMNERKNPKVISEGCFKKIRCMWRIVLDNGVYYYDVKQFDRFTGCSTWVNIRHSMDLADCLLERNDDFRRYGEKRK